MTESEYQVQVPGTTINLGISKHGGGTVGNRYSGWWSYTVSTWGFAMGTSSWGNHLQLKNRQYEGDDLWTSNITGGHTHMEAAMVLAGFLAHYGGGEAPEDMSEDMVAVLAMYHTELSLFDYENEDA